MTNYHTFIFNKLQNKKIEMYFIVKIAFVPKHLKLSKQDE